MVKLVLFLTTIVVITCSNHSKNTLVMDKKEFWKIINYAHQKSGNDLGLKSQLMIDKLSTYSKEQIIDFEVILRQLLDESDDFKIMAAQKIMTDYVSDDSYLYFRCWLISEGESTFNKTMKDVDYLSNVVSEDTEPDFEYLLLVATEAFAKKTGKSIDEEDETFPRGMADGRAVNYNLSPITKGTDWTEEQLPQLYPKLLSKFHN